MKRTIIIPVLAAGLLLAACNTDEQSTENEKVDNTPEEQTTGTVTEQEDTVETTENTAEETTEDTSIVETQVTEQEETTKAESSIEEVKIYKGDDNAENIVPSNTIPYSFEKNGPVTRVILSELGLMEYYNSHAVSADEKTITLDFKEDILSSDLVQGSAGAWIFAGEIYASFFNTVPTLETLNLRVNGKEVELDHISFKGSVTREDFHTAYPGVGN